MNNNAAINIIDAQKPKYAEAAYSKTLCTCQYLLLPTPLRATHRLIFGFLYDIILPINEILIRLVLLRLNGMFY